MMIGWTLRNATPTPLKMPIATATPKITGIVQTSSESDPRLRQVRSTAATLVIHGIERSMPPAMMTTVWPPAMIASATT